MAECKMNPEQVFKLIPDHVSEYARPYIRDHIKDLRARIAELEHTIEQLSQDIERRTKMYVDLEAENKQLRKAMEASLDLGFDPGDRMNIIRAALEETKPEPKIGEDTKCIRCGKELCGHEVSFCMECITGEIPKIILSSIETLEQRVKAMEVTK